MEKDVNNNGSNKSSSSKKDDKFYLKHTKELLIKEKEYEEYLKHIEKLSRGAYGL